MAKRAGTSTKDTHVVEDMAALRTMLDPLRLRMIAALEQPRTAKELAAAVGVVANKLYYHLRRLEEHGMIIADEGRGERKYRVSARRITVDPSLRPSRSEALGMIDAVMDAAGAQIRAALQPDQEIADGDAPPVTLIQTSATLSPAKLVAYQERLRKLMTDLDAEPVSTARGASNHSFLLAVFPTTRRTR